MISGTYINYYFHCPRHLWLFSRNITMEHNSEDVSIGKYISESAYGRANHEIHINNKFNDAAVLDFFERKSKVIHEIKKSKKMEELHIWQVKYYIYFLEKLGITEVTGEIDYPKLKRIVRVNLEDEDRKRFEEIFIEIESINNSSCPPQPINKPYCKKCSYFEFCYC